MKELFTNLYNYFKETYFSPDLSAIENFDTYDIQRFMPLIVVGLCVGVFIAVCGGYYHHQYLGRVVRKLYKAQAFDEKSAKSLKDIGCDSFFIKRNLTRETVLSKYVKPVEELTDIKSASNALFYLKEEDKYIADKRFKEIKGGKLVIIFAFLLCLFGCFGLLLILPDVFQLADNVINMTKPK